MTDNGERNNSEVFGRPETSQIPMVSTADRVREMFNIEIARDIVPLPSCGLVYPPEHPFHKKQEIEIRAMTARDEDILTSRALIKKGKVVSQLLSSCLTDKRVRASELLSGDRNAILVALRITGYGRDYPVEITCPSCDEKSTFSFDLTQMPIQRLELQPLVEGQNLFDFRFPQCKGTVNWRFMTGQDEEELTQLDDQKKKLKLKGEIDDIITARLLRSIVSINGNADRNQLSMAIPHLPSADSAALRTYISDHEPGIELKAMFTCDRCGESEEVSVPLTGNFFWPGSQR